MEKSINPSEIMPFIISIRCCCKVNLFFPTADAFLALGFHPKTELNQKITRKEVMSRYGIHKYSLSLMLPPDIFIKRKYKVQYNLGINLETKSERNLPNEMFKLDEQHAYDPCKGTIDCGRPQLEKVFLGKL